MEKNYFEREQAGREIEGEQGGREIEVQPGELDLGTVQEGDRGEGAGRKGPGAERPEGSSLEAD